MKLDLGCGTRKAEGFTGVDSEAFEGVDVVADLTQAWPWDDASIEEVRSCHFVEHLTNPQRVHFWNELYRVLKPGRYEHGKPVEGFASIYVPHWAHASAYGDPTHQWPPMTEWSTFYLGKDWRKINAPHVPLTCDFETIGGVSFDEWMMLRSQEFRTFAMSHYLNACRDLIFTVVKKHGVSS